MRRIRKAHDDWQFEMFEAGHLVEELRVNVEDSVVTRFGNKHFEIEVNSAAKWCDGIGGRFAATIEAAGTVNPEVAVV